MSLDESSVDANTLYSNDVEGEVRGLDIMLNRNLSNRWYGWVSVSLADSQRTNLRTGKSQNYAYDTPVVLNIVADYQLSEKWEIGARYSLISGKVSTDIIGITENPDFPDRYLPVYGEAYANRLPNYSRLDLRLSRDSILFGNDSQFYIDIRNVLNKENVESRSLDYEVVNATSELHVKDSVSMGIFGSIGFTVRF